MNYFAHGREHTGDPYFLAGTAVPDLLSVIDRRVRVRAKRAGPLADDVDPTLSAVARGVLQHLADDDWFHQTAAFHELNVALTAKIRGTLAEEDGYRPAFLGHILVEILLDAELIAERPELLDRYYASLQEVDPAAVERAVNRMSVRGTDLLAAFFPRFLSERFLYDYASDVKLLHRLNQVMRRVGLPSLPESLLELLPEARRLVASRRVDLLSAPMA
jgi:hypothetical protein